MKRIDDKEELIRIITHDPIEKVRLTALEKIDESLGLNKGHTKAQNLKAAILRHLGCDKAKAYAEENAKDDLLDLFAKIEYSHYTDNSADLEQFRLKLDAKKVQLNLTDEAYSWLLNKGFTPEYGAREMDRVVAQYLKPLLMRAILFGNLKKGGEACVDVVNGELAVK